MAYDTASLIRYAPPGTIDPVQWLDLVKRTVLGTDKQGNPRSNEDLALFLLACNRTRLDPLARQIYAVYRWDNTLRAEKMVIQTSIDGFRLIAQRTGQYGGQDDVRYAPEDESTKFPKKATVTVYRLNPKTGDRMPIPASARWDEYVPLNREGGVSGLWVKMPYLMLGKVAEALALRKAFPQELSGIYTGDEFGGDQVAEEPTPFAPHGQSDAIRRMDDREIEEFLTGQGSAPAARVSTVVVRPPLAQPSADPPTIDGTATVVAIGGAAESHGQQHGAGQNGANGNGAGNGTGNGNGNGDAKRRGGQQAKVDPAALPEWKQLCKGLAEQYEHYRFADGSPNFFQLTLSAFAEGYPVVTKDNLHEVIQKLADRAQAKLDEAARKAADKEAASTQAGTPE